MRASVIICTYRRVDSVRSLLACLPDQTCRDFETIVVDGSGDDPAHAPAIREVVSQFASRMDVRLVFGPKGLTRQRNQGLGLARGEVIFFLDDDVTFGPDFVRGGLAVFDQVGMEQVGGIAGYDVCNYPQPINGRWKLRRAFRIVPELVAGNIDRFGRSIPASFAEPFRGFRQVGYLYGFCMIYRRAAIGDLRFTEALPTYGGEDRDFSSRLARRGWRLLLCGDLHLEHHCAPQSRDTGVQRTYQAGFGIGWGFGKNARRVRDYAELGRVVIGEFVVDTLAWIRNPSRDTLAMTFARTRGFVDGLHAARRTAV